MLPGVCPGCGLRADLDVFIVQADAKQALAAALTLPPSLAGRILRYLRLFAPPSKTLALSKTARLLHELAEAVRSAQVTRRGVVHAAPVELWGAALDAILAQPPQALPLTSHGYLSQVAWNLAERSAARREQSIDERLRQGQRPAADPLPATLTPTLTPDPSLRGRGEAPARPARSRPPADFKSLGARLTGMGQFSATLTQDPSPLPPLPEGEGNATPTPTPTPIPTTEEHTDV